MPKGEKVQGDTKKWSSPKIK